MKTLIATALLTLVAGVAQAEIKLETRAFHSYMRLGGETAYSYFDGAYDPDSRSSVDASYHNAAGGGVAVIFHADEVLELGLGFDLTRYYPEPESRLTQQSIDAFTRWQLLDPGAFRLYVLGGVSNHDISGKSTASGEKLSVTPILNYDLGFGTSYRVGSVDLGFEYKFSNTLASGTATSVVNFPGMTSPSDTEPGIEWKTKIEGMKIENHTAALTAAVKL